MYNSIIIGKGPAGITASIYLKRAGINCLVIGKDEGSLLKTNSVENYYGFEKPIDGKELVNKGIKQAERIGVEVKSEEVVNIEFDGIFKIKTRDNIYEGENVILATGAKRNIPKINGIKKFEGKGISYCAVCDAFFFRGKKVGVLGSGDYAINEAKELIPFAKDVVILTNGKEIVQNRSISIEPIQKEIKEFTGDRFIEKVEFSDNTSINIDGIFIAEGVASSTDFARKLGASIDNNKILVNENMQTNIPGLYAAGDCTGGLLQISKAVYEGTKAALKIIECSRNK